MFIHFFLYYIFEKILKKYPLFLFFSWLAPLFLFIPLFKRKLSRLVIHRRRLPPQPSPSSIALVSSPAPLVHRCCHSGYDRYSRDRWSLTSIIDDGLGLPKLIVAYGYPSQPWSYHYFCHPRPPLFSAYPHTSGTLFFISDSNKSNGKGNKPSLSTTISLMRSR